MCSDWLSTELLPAKEFWGKDNFAIHHFWQTLEASHLLDSKTE